MTYQSQHLELASNLIVYRARVPIDHVYEALLIARSKRLLRAKCAPVE